MFHAVDSLATWRHAVMFAVSDGLVILVQSAKTRHIVSTPMNINRKCLHSSSLALETGERTVVNCRVFADKRSQLRTTF